MSRSSVPAPQANGSGGLVAATFALGFRPFFLAAALFAVIAVPVWVAVMAAALPRPAICPESAGTATKCCSASRRR